ncbi:MAG: 30S ribosomal protein S6 [Candidatus Omnitrophota bacterium]
MKSYEAMFILKPDLSSEDLGKTVSQIQEIVSKNKCSVDDMKDLGKQRLAYLVKKQKEGFYYLMNFHGDTSAIAKIKRSFSLNDSILRVLIIAL